MTTPTFDGPPEDRTTSPYTGWTRAHWENLADAQLAAVRPFATKRHALIDLPGPASRSGRHSDGLEGFARTFLLAGFRLAQSGDTDPGGHAEWYADGLTAGTDPSSPERWPRMTECGQAKVECASIAIALHESKRWIWDRLNDKVQQRIIAWMTDMHGTDVPANNWVWFRAITSAFLREVGAPWSAADIEHAAERTEAWYAGGGWYSDGGDDQEHGLGLRRFDHYSGWAMQYYPLWYCRISGPHADPAALPRYRRRLRRYLDDAQHLVGADGRPLLQGRSLTYRYAALCPLWVGAVFDASPLPPGRTRRLASGMIQHFMQAGCFDKNGIQPLGWHSQFTALRQPYSGPGSPYWSSKGFAGLVLPADHPVWTDKEQPLQIEQGDTTRRLAAPGWLVQGTAADGVVRIINHGTDYASKTAQADDPCYARLSYSTHAFPDSTQQALADPADSHAALLDPHGHPSHRSPLTRLHLGERTAASRHRAHWPQGPVPAPFAFAEPPPFRTGPWITTASILNGSFEVRLTRIDGNLDQPLRLRMGGYCLAADAPLHLDTNADAHPDTACVRRAINDGNGGSSSDGDGDGDKADTILASTVANLSGFDQAGIATAEDANALGQYSATPWLATSAAVQPGTVYGAVVCLSAIAAGPTVAAAAQLTVRQEPDGTSVATIHWSDGSKDTIRLNAAPPT
ncbi:MAG TPA: DUF2264 domain-containing protein [Actinocrinis sp.]